LDTLTFFLYNYNIRCILETHDGWSIIKKSIYNLILKHSNTYYNVINIIMLVKYYIHITVSIVKFKSGECNLIGIQEYLVSLDYLSDKTLSTTSDYDNQQNSHTDWEKFSVKKIQVNRNVILQKINQSNTLTL